MKALEPVTILDDAGVEHVYTGIPWPAEEGFVLCTQLFALIGPALGDVIGAVLSDGKVSVAKIANANIDGKAIGGAVTQLSVALAQPSNAALLARMLRGVKRDDKPLLENGKLGGNFHEAFAANYGELSEAIAWVVRENRVADFFVRLLRRVMPRQTETPEQAAPASEP